MTNDFLKHCRLPHRSEIIQRFSLLKGASSKNPSIFIHSYHLNDVEFDDRLGEGYGDCGQ
jgi:hypothetical protein